MQGNLMGGTVSKTHVHLLPWDDTKVTRTVDLQYINPASDAQKKSAKDNSGDLYL